MKKLTKALCYLCFIGSIVITPIAFSSITTVISADIGKSQIKGYSQTPKGGSADTTSFQRPSFTELAIKDDLIYQTEISLEYQNYLVSLDYIHLNPHGNHLLSQDLLTHSQFIPANSQFDLNIEYDWYRLAIGKDFYFGDHKWKIAPKLLAEWLKYQYHFSAPQAASSRSFSLVTSSLGFEIHRQFTRQFSAELVATKTLPLSNFDITSFSITLNYAHSIKPHLCIIPRIILGWFTLDYEDEQLVPNHIRYTASPYGLVGLGIRL